MTYPGGEVIEYRYGTAATSHERISRLQSLRENVPGTGAILQVRYNYLGLSMPATVDYAVPDIQLDFQPQHNGTRTAGQYAGFDRFGRVIKQAWVDGAYTTHGSSGSVPNIPPIVETTYSYDKASNRTKMLDGRPGALFADRDMVYTYDGLHRLQEAQRGVDGGSFTPAPGSEKWNLDMLGNWSKFLTDGNGDGDYLDANEETRRSHNDVNELTGVDLDGNGSTDISLTFDHAGNLREQPAGLVSNSHRYTHDLWNRLVKVEIFKGSVWNTIGEYQYYGTHWRSIKRSDTDNDVTLDEQREQYYSAGWQLIEERVYDSWSSGTPGTVDRTLQSLWGGRYIDDIVWHREDVNNDGDFTDAGDRRWWHCTDAQFSTVALVDDAAVLAERVRYDAYGRAAHFHPFDTDGDRDFDATDRTALSNLIASGSVPITSGSYDVSMDLDRDGDVDSTDLSIMGTGYTAALGLGALSLPGVGNTIGWDGYVFSAEVPGASGGGMYHVRFRWYEVGLGRWVQRDPAGYVDEQNLYQFTRSAPTTYLDDLALYGKRMEYIHPKCADGYTKRRMRCLSYDLDSSAAKQCFKSADEWAVTCNRTELEANPIPSSIKLCHRRFDKAGADCGDACLLSTADILTSGHAYLQRGDFDVNDFHGYGVYDVDRKKGDAPQVENATLLLRPHKCMACGRYPTPLEHGTGAGKLGVYATDDEIWDCISKHSLTRDFHGVLYNCKSWAIEASEACGLRCKDQGEAWCIALGVGIGCAR